MFLMSSFGLESLINVPTRVTPYTSTCIDHFFARLRSNDLSSLSSSAIDLKISDHHFIEIVFKSANIWPSKDNLKIVRKNKLNFALLNEVILQVDWSIVLSLNDPSLALDEFLRTISTVIEQCYSHVRINNVKLLQPWISYILAMQIKKRNQMHKKVKKHPNNLNLRETYERTCKQINVDIKSEKEAYYINRFLGTRSDFKKNWNLVNEILTKKPKVSSVKTIVTDNGTLLTNDIDIANDLNCYFTSIANDLRAKFFSINTAVNYDLPSDHCPKTFFMAPVSSNEILSVIESLELKHSLDNDGLSNCILKAISRIVSPVLSHIFNLSFVQGVVPARLKSATIIPVFKKGDRSVKGNYRPIALQPVILKVLEKVVKSRVNSFLNRFNVLSAHQHGFRQGMSTESALLEFLDTIHNGLNCGNVCAGLFVDASKAFDMVEHSLLLSILHDIGFRGVANKWFASYLKNRSVTVKINGILSAPKSVDVGVPQGSVLGPLLFLIYTNSIFKLRLNGSSTAFADDLALAYTAKSTTEITSMINSDLGVLHNWFDKHYLILSDKTKFMFFKLSGIITPHNNNQVTYHSVYKCSPTNCHTDCLNIELVNSFKYLGIHLDSNLNWKTHVSNLKHYLASASRIFYLLRDMCPVSVLKMTYHALVMAKIEYGLPCWGGCFPTVLKPLYVQQKMILRTILRKKRTESSWVLFKANNILPLQHLYVYKVLKIFFRRSGQQVIRFDERYNFRVNHQFLYGIPRFYNDHFRRYILVASPTFFNNLPDLLRRQIHSKSFMARVKDWLFETPDVTNLFRVVT